MPDPGYYSTKQIFSKPRIVNCHQDSHDSSSFIRNSLHNHAPVHDICRIVCGNVCRWVAPSDRRRYSPTASQVSNGQHRNEGLNCSREMSVISALEVTMRFREPVVRRREGHQRSLCTGRPPRQWFVTCWPQTSLSVDCEAASTSMCPTRVADPPVSDNLLVITWK